MGYSYLVPASSLYSYAYSIDDCLKIIRREKLKFTKEQEKIVRRGRELHKELGFDNKLKFYRYICVDKYSVILYGIPDKIEEDKIVELKCVLDKYRITKKKIFGATLQLLSYLYMLDYDYGEVHFYSFDKELLDVVEVKRDDLFLKSILKDICMKLDYSMYWYNIFRYVESGK